MERRGEQADRAINAAEKVKLRPERRCVSKVIVAVRVRLGFMVHYVP
jgi:hypothetical protein